jgi:hypothetical protein
MKETLQEEWLVHSKFHINNSTHDYLFILQFDHIQYFFISYTILVDTWPLSMLRRASSLLNPTCSALVLLSLRSLAEYGILETHNVEISSICLDM